mgnify:CR=1 FL=1
MGFMDLQVVVMTFGQRQQTCLKYRTLTLISVIAQKGLFRNTFSSSIHVLSIVFCWSKYFPGVEPVIPLNIETKALTLSYPTR